jgi:hypothetical protein
MMSDDNDGDGTIGDEVDEMATTMATGGDDDNDNGNGATGYDDDGDNTMATARQATKSTMTWRRHDERRRRWRWRDGQRS